MGILHKQINNAKLTIRMDQKPFQGQANRLSCFYHPPMA